MITILLVLASIMMISGLVSGILMVIVIHKETIEAEQLAIRFGITAISLVVLGTILGTIANHV